MQSDPPYTGAGELQSRLRVCDPAPHVTVQSAYSPQSDHAPSTNLYILTLIELIYFLNI